MSKIVAVDSHRQGEVSDALLAFAVIVSEYGGKWIYCRHRERDTWELPGGRREPGEDILQTARRELFEETGAAEFSLEPVCVYSVARDDGSRSYGILCRASITALGSLPESEIAEIGFFADIPEKLTYPEIQPKLFDLAQKSIPS